jgi:hypothetical protein
MGIEVHPLAVIIARATYVLAIRDLLQYAVEPVTIPVFLANSLRLPVLDERRSLFGDPVVELTIADKQYPVPLDFIHNGADYDATIEDFLTLHELTVSLTQYWETLPKVWRAASAIGC